MAIGELVRDKTLIVIARRLPTIRDADQIVVLDGGASLQRGKHEDLIAQKGLYRNFWRVRESAREWKLSREF